MSIDMCTVDVTGALKVQEGNLPHPKEQDRLVALHELQLLETPIEQRFEHVTMLLKAIFNVPVSALSLIDLHRQWFKSIQGLRVEQTRRCVSFCQHTILGNDVLVIPDARFDDRFGNNPLVTDDPGIVFYAGVPVRTPEGLPVASLCLIGFEPRSLDQHEIEILKQFGRLVESLILTPRANTIEDSIINQIGESWRSSMIDPLTRLWNAEGVQTLIRETIIHAKRSGDQVAVAMLSLEGLDAYKEVHGIPAYERLIQEFSQKATTQLVAFDSIGHLRDGDFGIMMTRVASAEDALKRLAKIRDIARSFSVADDHGKLPIDASIACIVHEPGSPTQSPQIIEYAEDLITQIRHGDAINPIRIVFATETGTFRSAA